MQKQAAEREKGNVKKEERSMKEKKKYAKKVLSAFLALVMAVEIIPLGSYAADRGQAEETESGYVQEAEAEKAAEVEVVSEDTERREEYVKHFNMSDGTKQAAQYAVPVHYKDAAGEWNEYDNSLEEIPADAEEQAGDTLLSKSKDLKTVASDTEIRLSKKLNDKKFVRVEKDGYELSWYYRDANQKSARIVKSEESEDRMSLMNAQSETVYRNVFSGVDLQYIISGGQVKENIILKEKGSKKSFTAEYKGNGLTAVQRDSRTVDFLNESGEAQYTVSAPYMEDAKGETCSEVTLTLESQKNGKCTVKTELDESWLTDAERAYPVTVDPILTTKQEWPGQTAQGSDIHSAYVASGTPNTCYGFGGSSYEGSLYVGNEKGRGKTRTLIKSVNLPALQPCDKVVDAQFSIYLRDCDASVMTYLYEVTEPWNQSKVTWNTQPWVDWERKTDYKELPKTSTHPDDVWMTYEITKLVRAWYAGEKANNGFMLYSPSESDTSYNRGQFPSSGYPTLSGVRPCLLISYRNMSGYEEYWSYTSVAAGRYGTLSVNNYNGNVVTAQPLTLDAGGNLMPVSVSLVYNSNRLGLGQYSYAGYGVQTNYHMYIRENPYLNSKSTDEEKKYKYYFNDADGTQHYFYFKELTDTTAEDEDGLGYKLSIDNLSATGDQTKFTITDKDKNKMLFNGDGNVQEVRDAEGNTAHIHYQSVPDGGPRRLWKIEDGAGRTYTFKYHDQKYGSTEYQFLVGVTDPAGRETVFDYEHGRLWYIRYPDGETVTFSSNGNNMIDQVINCDGNYITVQYSGNSERRARRVWNTHTGTESESYTFAYRQNETEVTDLAGRSYTYQFNDYGQTTGIVSNVDGQAQFFDYHPGNTKDAKANKMLSESKVIVPTTNYVTDPSFSYPYDQNYTRYTEGPGWNIVNDGGQSCNASGSLNVYKMYTTGSAYVHQPLKLEAGTYTFSGVVYTGGQELGGTEGVFMAVQFRDENNNLAGLKNIDKVTKTSGWERQSVTFDLPAGWSAGIVLGLYEGASGNVWFDELQVEKGTGDTSVNLIPNNNYVYGVGGLQNWEADGHCDVVSTNGALPGYGKAVRIQTESPKNSCRFGQKLNSAGRPGEVYNFGSWVRADSAPLNNGTKDKQSFQPKFRLSVEFYNTEGALIDRQTKDFNADVNTWQFNSMKVVSRHYYDRMAVRVEYDGNINACDVTGMFLYKEEYGQSYTYDKDGNVISSVDLAKSQSEFSYNGNQMAKMFNPSGSRYIYSYNDQNRLMRALSSDGQEYSFGYDDKGNVTETTVQGVKPAQAVIPGSFYYIVNAYSGNALDGGLGGSGTWCGTYPYKTPYQKWGAHYYGDGEFGFLSAAHDGLFLDVQGISSANGTILETWEQNSSAAQRFKPVSNGDGTFTILTGATGFTKCVDGQYDNPNEVKNGAVVKQNEYNPENVKKGQKWYFYPVNPTYEKELKTETEYRASKNFVQSTADQRGNRTWYAYDEARGLMERTENAAGKTTVYDYDNGNNRLNSVALNGVTNSYSYSEDRLSRINANGGTYYDFTYDKFGRALETSVGNGSTNQRLVLNTYDTLSRLTNQEYGNGRNVAFTYDNLDRITGKKYNGDTQQRVEYEYGPDGNLAFVMDHAVGTRTQFIYDMAGRVATEKEFATTARGDRTVKSSVRYAYENKTNRLTGVSHLFAGNTQDIGYRYGNLGSGEMPDQIYDVTWNGAKKQSYSYDGLGRLTNKQLFTTSGQTVNNFYTYIDVAGTNKTTTLVQKMDTAAGTYSYTYDVLGNISTVSDGTHTTRYQYDALGQMEYVRDEKADTETYYGYTNGNITYRSVYSLTSGKLIEWDNWTYGNDQWKDLLTTYNSKTFRDDENGNGMTIDHGDQGITYDGIGNPLTIGEKRFYWHNVNQLNIIWEGSNLYEYSYDVDNQRYKKNVNGVETEFFYNGSTLAGQKTGNDMLVFMYDDNGDAFGFKYNGTEYYYVRNAQNDITAVLDANQNIVASYVYDAWGQILSSTGDMADINPLRYRGYYYDTETGYYYLNSRYYSPELCRFLNADDADVLDVQDDLYDKNLFAYCDNNSVMRVDHGGDIWETILDIAGIVWSAWDLITKPSWANLGYLAWDVGAALVPFAPGSYTAKGAKLGTKMFSKVDDLSRAGKSFSKIDDVGKGGKRIFNVSKQNSKIFNKFKSVKGKSYRYSGTGKSKKYYDWDFTHNDIEVYDKNGKHLGSMNPSTGKMYKDAVKGRRLW